MPLYPELQVVGWTSGYHSIQTLLKALKKMKLAHDDAQAVLESIELYCNLVGKNPDEVIAAQKAGDIVDSRFDDELRKRGASEREISARNAHLILFLLDNKAM